ncbi:MAG: type IV pilus secretin PilQ, partial [Pseudobdellovibrionaceae bacterium]
MTFTTRQNAANNQFIIEIPDSHLPDSLKRPFNTKDFNGDIGSIDAYQNANSNITRIVVQLRPGAIEPTISQEGTSLLVMTQKPTTTAETSEVASEPVSENVALEEQTQKTENEIAADQILSSRSLEAYLTNNQQFYGSPISIEMDDLELKQALKFIAEESGLNMVIDSGVGGAVSLKLRQVPWDQALVVILKSRQLGYVRQGNILRIATLADLQKEEKAVIDSTAARQTLAPLVVRLIPVSYAKVDDMEKQVKNFLTEKRGQVVADARTGSLVITDTDENIKRIEQVVKSLDIAPPQVLIEGKIVEASESFSREFGVNWGFNGRAQRVGDMGGRAINMRPSLGVNNSSTIAGRNLNAGFTLGTLDIFGDLSAALSLSENEQKVKVLSSPRIVALHNQQASIEQRTQLPITQATNVSGVVTTGVTYKDVTLNLKVTPQITADNSVIMALNVVREFASAKDPTNNFSVNSRNASTTVIVRNGQTAVIGGIYQDDSTNSEDGVPWLRKIPILGGLFAATTTTNNKAELLIFLT